jgi:N-acetylglucosaminyldiphosphoundecaprenol N-acetyl-beta-D-mannosaminyltransferase
VLGSDTASVERFAAHLASEFPGIVILGYRNGYFDDEAARLAEARRIAQMKPDFVLVGMGAVRQEEFVLSLFAQGFEGAAATCGGFIHQTARSGRSYYPAWIDRFNLRFVYRMYDEPSLVRRYLLDYPRAFALILGDLCRKSPEGESAGAAMEKSR